MKGYYYFNGSTDYLTVPDDSSFNIGTEDFTISCWVYFNSTSGYHAMLATAGPTEVDNGWQLWQYNGDLLFRPQSPNYITTSVSTSQWYHVAITGDGTTVRGFLDGELFDTVSQGTLAYASQGLVIGRLYTGVNNYQLNGYMAEIEIIKGTAKWTEDFDPPVGPILTSTYNKKQLVVTDENDNKLNTEIAYWDDVYKTASLWTAVPTLTSGTNADLYLYYDVTASGSTTRTTAESGDTFTGTDGDLPDKSLWRITTGTPDIQSNSLRLTFHGTSTDDRVLSTYEIDGDFDVQVDFSLSSVPATTGWGSALLIYAGSGDYLFVYRGYSGGHNYYKELTVGSSTVQNLSTSTSDTSGKFRAVRSGSNIYGYYWNGSGWTEIGSVYSSGWTGSVYVGVQNFEWTGNPSGFYCDFDNFTVNSADKITGFTGDTGEAPAQAVWDTNFRANWHLDQTSTTMLDSTSNEFNATAVNTPTSVLGVTGRTLEFDSSSSEYLSVDTKANLVNGITDFTLNVMANVNDWSDNLVFFSNAENSPAYHQLTFGTYGQTDGTLVVYLPDDVGHDFTTVMTNNDLAMYTLTRNGTNLSLYENGVHVETISCNTNALGPTPTDKQNIASSYGGSTYSIDGSMAQIDLSEDNRSAAWVKANYYSTFNDLITFAEGEIPAFANFIFSGATPNSTTVYGVTEPLYINVTVSGSEPSYIYDAYFYDGGDTQIGTTVSGATNGSQVTRTLSTPSGTSYSWYVTATASGFSDTSDTYTFDNRFLCAGYTMVNGTRASGIPVRLYRRADGELIGTDTTSGVSGTFEIESLYNEQHYAVALHPTETINALIYDHIEP
jgi:hypothetical protein